MNDLDAMQLLLCMLLLASGLLRLVRQTCCRTQAAIMVPVFAAVIGYGFFSAALCMIIVLFAGMGMLLPALLLLTGAGTAAALGGNSRLRARSEVFSALLTGVWLAVLAAVTILLRQPSETDTLLRFDAFSDVSRYGSLEPLIDVVMNVVLFLPLGLLLPRADNERYVWMNVLSTALMLTASVEAFQLLFSLGQADVEDLAANVLGAMAGFMLYRIHVRQSHP